MHIPYGPDRKMFQSFSKLKGYDDYLIAKVSYNCLGQDSIVNRDGQSVSGKTVEKEIPERLAGKYSDEWSASGTVRVKKQRKNFVILELQGEQYLFTMTLFRPEHLESLAESNKMMSQKPEMVKKMVSDHAIARHSFTVAEVSEFVESVHDTNRIHQMAIPIVPGLLMAEWFFTLLQSTDWEAVEMRFRVPVYVGQTLCIGKNAEKYICYGENTRQVFWTASVTKVARAAVASLLVH